jgi:hypothetical protein
MTDNELLKQADEYLAKPNPVSYSAHIADSIVTTKLIQALSTKVIEQSEALEAIDGMALKDFCALLKDNQVAIDRLQKIEDITQYTLYGTEFVKKSAKAAISKPIQAKKLDNNN